MSTFPVRCFTCGKLIGNLFEDYSSRVENGEDSYSVLDDLKVGRSCCRRMFTTHVDADRFAELYPTHPGRIQVLGPVKSKLSNGELTYQREKDLDDDHDEEDQDEGDEDSEHDVQDDEDDEEDSEQDDIQNDEENSEQDDEEDSEDDD
jgi:DNA-directed RNA polymerase subunit N